MADTVSKEQRHRNMAAIRSRDTKPEMFLRKALFSLGYRYRIAPPNIYGHPDMFIARYKVAIFVHGCFWHRHEGCKFAYTPKSRVEFWNTKFMRNVTRDLEVRTVLMERGTRVLVVWECAINRATRHDDKKQKLLDEVIEFITSSEVYLEIPAKSM